ncbi:MAG: ribulose-phosphate 3-epimerase [Bacilli bacterium]
MLVSVSVLGVYNRLIPAVMNVNNTSANFLHVDVMDGIFVDNKKFPYEVVKDVKLISKKKLDIHLMVNDYSLIYQYALLKPEYLTFHVEIINDYTLIDYVKSQGIKVGLAINPDTKIEKILPYIDDVDMILFMSVDPGQAGQSFDYNVLDKISRVKEVAPAGLVISVDGGINVKTKELCEKAGCNMVVSGSFITNSLNYEEKIELLK